MKNIHIKKDQFALQLNGGEFVKFLAPGQYRFLNLLGKTEVVVFDMEFPEFTHEIKNYLLRCEREIVNQYFHLVEPEAEQVVLRFEGQSLCEILRHGTPRLFWKAALKAQRFETIDLNQVWFKHSAAEYLRLHLPEVMAANFYQADTNDKQALLRFEQGELLEIVPPLSKRLYWRNLKQQEFICIDLQQARFEHQVEETLRLRLPHLVKEYFHVVSTDAKKAVLRFENGVFAEIIPPASQRLYWKIAQPQSFEVFDLAVAWFDHASADFLRQNHGEVVAEYFHQVDTSDQQVMLRFENAVLAEIIPPASRRLYWRASAAQAFECIDISKKIALDQDLLGIFVQQKLRGKHVQGLDAVCNVQVPESHVGLLRVDGKLERILQPGRSAYWRFNRDIQLELVDLRLQNLEVSGQEILTRDKVNLRINLNASWQFVDVELAHAKLAKPAEHVYRELQFALRAAVGTRSLDELLENKQVIDQVVEQHMTQKLAGFGICLQSFGVKDIILPGEMKQLLTQVVEAEKAAQANVIRRREETNATRSMLNTAKVMENNPTALRLKELETLERIAERIDKISVVGGLDQVLNGLIKIQPNQA